MEINNDRSFLDNLIESLSKIIDSNWRMNIGKPLIYMGENASKGIHIFTNTSRKDILETFFKKKDAVLKVGSYNISSKDIKFLKMKESKWEIEIPYLKSSNGTLKVNIDKMSKLARSEIILWLSENIISHSSILNTLDLYAKCIANIDVLQSNCLTAIEKGYTCPIIDLNKENSYLNAGLIRHPIIEHIMQTQAYIPNDIALGADKINDKINNLEVCDGILLFGVNAVGKSSLMKSLGLAVIMAQAGMYVAASQFIYKPFKYLFTRILGNDNLYAGLSSFEVEMKEFKVILKYSNADSLLLCDEVCRGTVMEDGTALVASALEILSRRKVKFLSATHLHNLTTMDCIKKLDNIKFYHLLVVQDKVNPEKLIYTRKLQPGSGPSSYGILVAQSMNMDKEFITRAQEIRTMIGEPQTPITDAKIGISKYNKEKVIAKCEICLDENATDVHHINQQCDANELDLLDTFSFGIFNKNKLWNLVSLCKKCHQSIHCSPPRLKINGYCPTSNGLELNYTWIKTETELLYPLNNQKYYNSYNNPYPTHQIQSECGKQANGYPHHEHDSGDSDAEYYSISDGLGDNISDMEMNRNNDFIKDMDKRKQNTKKIKNHIKQNISPEIKQQILEMKNNNATPKKIQFNLKRFYNIEISQQQIREIS